MKLNNTKIINKKFDPIRHWYIVLFIFFVSAFIIIAYSVYSFLYIKNEISIINIDAKNSIKNSTSTDVMEKTINDTKFLKDVNNLNNILEKYQKKEVEYKKLVNSDVVLIIATTTTISSDMSTVVATSTP